MYRIDKPLLFLAAATAMSAFLPLCGSAQPWTNGQDASYVIGQTGFGNEFSTLSPTGLSGPSGIAVDPATGKVFVADGGNNRVLRYPSTASMTNGAAAEAVLGQPNLSSNDYGASATTFYRPYGLAIDASGNLWVADKWNSRILCFSNAATIASDAAASVVLGQPNFTSSTSGITQASINFPFGIFCSGMTLWVADTYNNRILGYYNAASKANGGLADVVIGQTGFTTNGDGTSATQLLSPTQAYVDGADNLWVADFGNSRVLMFPNASTTGSGAAATMVLGQTSLTTNASGLTASNFGQPSGVYGDGMGNIYVSDSYNRVLIFANAASLPNGSPASYVLGQPNFTTADNGSGANQLLLPLGLYVGATLMVADDANNRVVIYTPSEPLPLLLTGFTGRLQNNGQVLLQWQISDVPGGSASGGYVQLQYSTTDSSGFTDVLNTQPVDPAVSNYSYVQVSPAVGANYYRVKLTAPDGSVAYSQVVTIGVDGSSTALGIYPNPAHSSVVVTLPKAGSAVIEVYNSAGVLVRQEVNVNTIDVSSLAAGVYTVRVVQGGNAMTSSFVKVN